MTNEILSQAIEAILAARDFCADEAEALKEFQWDNGIVFTQHEIDRVKLAANNKWAEFQKQCGAKMLTGNERAQAFRDLEGDFLP